MSGLFTKVFRVFGYVMLLFAMVSAFVTVRLMNDAKESIKAATFALETGERDLATDHLEDAAKSYVPGSPFPRKALRDLSIMARAAEMRGEMTRTLAIWESIRRSVIATRHIRQPNEDILAEAESNIVRLRNNHAPVDANISLTARPTDPSPVLSLLIFFGLVLWILGTAALCYAAAKSEPTAFFHKITLLGMSVGGASLWLVSAWLV